MDTVDRIFEILVTGASMQYGQEPVSQLEHALQCASLAEDAGVGPALVAAALLHDIGHLINPDEVGAFERGEDARHEARGATFLAKYLPSAVTESVRWHVDAKRYLTNTEPAYYAQLSALSKRSLELQGGPFDANGATAFRARPHAEAAIQVRRWDDAAKVGGARTRDLAHFRPCLEACLTPERS